MKGDFTRYGKYKFGDKRLMELAWSPSDTMLANSRYGQFLAWIIPSLANSKPRAWRPGKHRQA